VIVDGPFRPPTRIDPRSVAQSIASSGVSEDDLLQRVAPQLGDIDVLKWLRSRSRSSTSSDDFRWKGYASMSAALEGHIEVLAWLQTEGCPPTPFSCTVAALGGHIHVLTWLREHGYPWGTETCTAAASGGKLQTLRWLIDNRCPWDAAQCWLEASRRGCTEVLTWMQENGHHQGEVSPDAGFWERFVWLWDYLTKIFSLLPEEQFPAIVEVSMHEHRLTRTSSPYPQTQGWYACDACLQNVPWGRGEVYHCGSCYFDLHPSCALGQLKKC